MKYIQIKNKNPKKRTLHVTVQAMKDSNHSSLPYVPNPVLSKIPTAKKKDASQSAVDSLSWHYFFSLVAVFHWEDRQGE